MKIKSHNREEWIKDIIIIGVLVFMILLILSIFTNKAGVIGSFLQNLIFGIFGISAYILPFYCIAMAVVILMHQLSKKNVWRFVNIGIILLCFSSYAHIISNSTVPVSFLKKTKQYYVDGSWQNGGVIGGWIGDGLLRLFGRWGSYIFIIALITVLLIILFQRSLIKDLYHIYQKLVPLFVTKEEAKGESKKKEDAIEADVPIFHEETAQTELNGEPESIQSETEERQIKILDFAQLTGKKKKQEEDKESSSEDIMLSNESVNYQFPPIDFLQENEEHISSSSRDEIIKNANKLEKTLASFGVKAKVIQVSRGPAVTRYELQPNQGVKVSKIVNLADDIALSLAASGIRIEAPIPGKSAVGIEVPNRVVQPVYLREVIETENFSRFPSNLAFAVGKDIGGQAVVADIARMPHMLIAGATGSGKSVCINSLIISILYKSHPNDVKLLMVDPKVVELSVYNGIPHLLIPVVNDPKKAAGALHWAVQEMTKRYQLFAEYNVRDVKGFNSLMEDEQEEKMPQIVIIIDELADLMMAAPKEVEDSICRLAQMARAAGIHLVIATQRPSVDVITGVIKANIPSRLAFAVSSGTDSRTILDMNGAEKLLGKGDMLFNPVGENKPIRVQGAFVSDKEVKRVVDFVKQDEEIQYNEQLIDEIAAAKNLSSTEDGETDEHLTEAVELVVEKQKASISMFQRVFRIGFNRASRMMDELYERGVVGPEEGSKPRKVLVSKEQYEAMKNENK